MEKSSLISMKMPVKSLKYHLSILQIKFAKQILNFIELNSIVYQFMDKQKINRIKITRMLKKY